MDAATKAVQVLVQVSMYTTSEITIRLMLLIQFIEWWLSLWLRCIHGLGGNNRSWSGHHNSESFHLGHNQQDPADGQETFCKGKQDSKECLGNGPSWGWLMQVISCSYVPCEYGWLLLAKIKEFAAYLRPNLPFQLTWLNSLIFLFCGMSFHCRLWNITMLLPSLSFKSWQMLKEAAVSLINDVASSVFGKAQAFVDKARARVKNSDTVNLIKVMQFKNSQWDCLELDNES